MKKKALNLFTVFSMVLSIFCILPINVIRADAESFTPRYSAPSTSDSRYYGSNPFYKSGYGMPNCTCYAYGRAWEILGSEPALSHGNAGKWYWENKSSGKYSYGSTPKLGAIACWDKNDKNQGHVAVVEAINGSRVTLSESHYSGVLFDNKEMNADGSDYLKSFRFLGYIYIGDFSINRLPNGVVDSCSGGKGCVNIDGWCFDPDDMGAQLAVHIYLGTEGDAGTCIGSLKADTNRPDVHNVYGCGEYHGYSGTLTTDIAPGKYFVRAAFLDSAGGTAKWAEGGWITVEYNAAASSLNLGDNFDAEIVCTANGRYVFASSSNNNVALGSRDLSGLYASKRVWNFSRQPDNSYIIASYYNACVLDVTNLEDTNGTNVQTCPFNGSDAQRWFIIPNGDNGCYLQPVCSDSRVLDVSGEEMGDHSNIQIWDKNDTIHQRFNIYNVSVDADAPVIKDVKISNVTSKGYNVTITASDNVGIKKVAVPTWTKKNGQDDLFADWGNTALAMQTGMNTWEYYVKASDHNNEGDYYYTDIYVWDFANKEASYSRCKVNLSAANLGDNFDAVITCLANGKFVVASSKNNNVILTSESDSGAYASKKVWNFSRQPDNSYVITSYYNSKVLDLDNSNNEGNQNGRNVGTYDLHGGENQRWYIIPKGDGCYLQPALATTNRVLDVDGEGMADHSNMQIWDKNGSDHQIFGIYSLAGDKEKPVIKDVKISNISSKGYTVTITTVDNMGVKKVAVPTWTDKNGQDDLFKEWDKTALASQSGLDTWEYYVKASDHNNEFGSYTSHIYVYDFTGNYATSGKIINVGMYNLTVDPNGGILNDKTDAIVLSPNLIYNTGNWFTLKDYIPVRNGYTFTGWYTAKTGGTKVYGADGKCVNEGTYFKDNVYQYEGDLKVYAHWDKNIIKGDANNDGEISTADLVMLQKWLLGSSKELPCWQNADLCEDGVIDAFDMVMLRKLLTSK